MESKRAVCLMSGGLDSAVAAAEMAHKEHQIYALTLVYGQKTSIKETECARQVAEYLSAVEHRVVDLRCLKELLRSGLTDEQMWLTYENRSLVYVPFRNSIFLSIAVAWAESLGAGAVIVGSHRADVICPDNSPEYVCAFQDVVRIGTSARPPIEIVAPFVHVSKAEVVRRGLELNAPFHLTWTCFNAEHTACGQCTNCLDRLAAFAACGVDDPIPYATASARR